MENAETILVIILSTFLAIFLALAIVLTIKLIKIVNRVNHITEAAEHIVDKAEHAAEIMSKAAAPAAIGNLIANLADAVAGRKSKRKKR